MRSRVATVLLLAVTLLLGGCGTYPKDPNGSLAHIDSSHVLRVGASANAPLVEVNGSTVSGEEAELIQGFAQTRGARVEWTTGGEEELVAKLKEKQLDVVIGGFTKQTPWSKEAAVTRPYGKRPSPATGKDEPRVLLAGLGENALVVALERYDDGREQK